ncbi:MAG: hypothetical protein L0Y45_08850, partial [Woeseiaceae bacterium]|nr:hypothetical protein [Woeseiaceae bacterium]
ALTLALASARNDESIPAVALMINATVDPLDFRLPDADSSSDWQMTTASTDELPVRLASRWWPVPARSICCAVLERRAAQSGG